MKREESSTLILDYEFAFNYVNELLFFTFTILLNYLKYKQLINRNLSF